MNQAMLDNMTPEELVRHGELSQELYDKIYRQGHDDGYALRQHEEEIHGNDVYEENKGELLALCEKHVNEALSKIKALA